MKKYADPGKVRLFSFYKLYSDSSVFNVSGQIDLAFLSTGAATFELGMLTNATLTVERLTPFP